MARKTEAGKETIYLLLEGEVTVALVPELGEAIFPVIASNDEIEIDLSRVTEMDAAGMQLMITVKLEAILRDKKLRFVGHSLPVLEIFERCDLGGFFGDPIADCSSALH